MTTAVLIHGFSGSPESWRRIGSLLDVASHVPAVRGHAGSRSGTAEEDRVVRGAFEAEVERLAAGIEAAAPAPRYLAGYSLGGRLALGLLVRHPGLFAGAALIGANPGIDDEDERAERRAADEAWARLIEERGPDAFDRKWSDLPLFRSQRRVDAARIEEQRTIRLGHDRAALAWAMRGLSLGAMPDYRPALAGIRCPVELIAGGEDPKFVALARLMAGLLPAATVRVVEGAGHNVPLEAPAELARLLNRALERIVERRPGDGRRE